MRSIDAILLSVLLLVSFRPIYPEGTVIHFFNFGRNISHHQHCVWAERLKVKFLGAYRDFKLIVHCVIYYAQPLGGALSEDAV